MREENERGQEGKWSWETDNEKNKDENVEAEIWEERTKTRAKCIISKNNENKNSNGDKDENHEDHWNKMTRTSEAHTALHFWTKTKEINKQNNRNKYTQHVHTNIPVLVNPASQ